MVVPYGSEFRVNTTTSGNQDAASVAALANGKFVVTWHDNGDIRAQIFNGNGSKSGAEITVTGASGIQKAPVVAGLNDGRFVIAWENHNASLLAGDGSGASIWTRVFKGDGTVDTSINGGNQILVNDTYAVGNQVEPAITAHRDGGYIITWTNPEELTGNLDIHGRLFSGPPAGSEFIISDTSAVESQSTIAGLSNGNYVVIWKSDSNISGQIMSGQSPVDGPLAVNTTTADVQFAPAVSASTTGFEIVWTHTVSASVHQIRGRSFTNDGSAPNDDFQVPQTNGSDQTEGAIAIVNDANFPIWRDSRSLGGDSSGTHIEGPGGLLINRTVKAGGQSAPAITALKDGRFVVVWTDPGIDPAQGDTSGNSVRAAIFDPRTKVVALGGSALDDDFVGTAFADTMNGQDGNDRLDGAAGDDTLGGGDGNDMLFGGNGNDKLFGSGTGADLMRGGGGNDTYIVDNAGHVVDESVASSNGVDRVLSSISFSLADAVHAKGAIENLALTGSTGINGTGNDLANVITGNAGANILNGGQGNDTLTGGGGKDLFVFNTAFKPAKNVDAISDFVVGEDAIMLDNAIFTKLRKTGALNDKFFEIGKKASDGNDYIVYNKKTGALSYDKDGDGHKHGIVIAKLSDHLHLTGDDFLVI